MLTLLPPRPLLPSDPSLLLFLRCWYSVDMAITGMWIMLFMPPPNPHPLSLPSLSLPLVVPLRTPLAPLSLPLPGGDCAGDVSRSLCSRSAAMFRSRSSRACCQEFRFFLPFFFLPFFLVDRDLANRLPTPPPSIPLAFLPPLPGGDTPNVIVPSGPSRPGGGDAGRPSPSDPCKRIIEPIPTGFAGAEAARRTGELSGVLSRPRAALFSELCKRR